MSVMHKCRHIAKGEHRPATTIHHRAIIGATRADELDDHTELCPICSAAVLTFLHYLEAEDARAAKDALFRQLGAMKN